MYNIRQRMGKAGNHHPHQPEEFLQRFQLSAGQQCEKNPLRGKVKLTLDFRLPPPCTKKSSLFCDVTQRKFPRFGMTYRFHLQWPSYYQLPTDLCCMTSQKSETSTLKIQRRSGGRCTELLSVAPV